MYPDWMDSHWICIFSQKKKICFQEHKLPRSGCIGLLSVEKLILDDGFINLNEAFQMSNPGIK